MKDEVNTKAKEIIEQIIKPGMSDIDKAKAIHDYIIRNTKYDYENWLNNTIPPVSYTAYGVLIKGMGVCQGYTEAFNLLAQLTDTSLLSYFLITIASTMTKGKLFSLNGLEFHAVIIGLRFLQSLEITDFENSVLQSS